MATLHNDLSSLLTNVWENRQTILYANPATPEDKTIEDRVYAFYAPNNPIDKSGIDKATYRHRLHGITSPVGKAKWTKSIRGVFHVWDVGGRLDSSVGYRVYLNAKPEYAVALFKHIMTIASVNAPPPPRPARLGMPMTPPKPTPVVTEQVIRSGLVAKARRSDYGEGLAAVKIADENEAFTNRPDKIVVYTNTYGGQVIANMLAAQLGQITKCFNPNIPPMTQQIALGVATGPEVIGEQWNVGTSFGEVRCNLIARALLTIVTGKSPSDVPLSHQVPHFSRRFNQTAVPAPFPAVASPNRLDFVNLVVKLFQDNKINPEAPWT